jgi:hypothetical protein
VTQALARAAGKTQVVRMDAGTGPSLLVGLGWVTQRVAAPGEINHAFLDPYSLLHFAVGAILAPFLASFLGSWRFGLAALLIIAVGWELGERIFKDLTPAIFPHPTQDTLANSVGDVLSALAGWLVGRRLIARARHAVTTATGHPR